MTVLRSHRQHTLKPSIIFLEWISWMFANHWQEFLGTVEGIGKSIKSLLRKWKQYFSKAKGWHVLALEKTKFFYFSWMEGILIYFQTQPRNQLTNGHDRIIWSLRPLWVNKCHSSMNSPSRWGYKTKIHDATFRIMSEAFYDPRIKA